MGRSAANSGEPAATTAITPNNRRFRIFKSPLRIARGSMPLFQRSSMYLANFGGIRKIRASMCSRGLRGYREWNGPAVTQAQQTRQFVVVAAPALPLWRDRRRQAANAQHPINKDRGQAPVMRLISVMEPQGKLIAACPLRGCRRVWRFRTCGACELEEGQGHPRARRIAQRTVPQ